MMKYKVPTEKLVQLYEVDLRTMQQIADTYGMTRQAVWHRLKKVAKSAFKATTIQQVCQHCLNPFVTYRAKIIKHNARFCSRRCFHESTSMYGALSKQGTRKARAVTGAALGEIPHHIDGNDINNQPHNLVVFTSNASHMSFHQSGKAKLLDEIVRLKELRNGGPYREEWALQTVDEYIPEKRKRNDPKFI